MLIDNRESATVVSVHTNIVNTREILGSRNKEKQGRLKTGRNNSVFWVLGGILAHHRVGRGDCALLRAERGSEELRKAEMERFVIDMKEFKN